ncbi:MAG: L-amino acid N-acyltransferase YncA [Planctomycetota bacterium]|jgi:L-amino acid N-acyltransferase YncA
MELNDKSVPIPIVTQALVPEWTIEAGREEWLPSVAQLSWECHGGKLESHQESTRETFDDCPVSGQLFVARAETQILGFAWISRLSPRDLPRGWYLSGIVVAPASRRQGVGLALTQERLRWLGERTRTAFYITSSSNQASIELHEHVGFQEIECDIQADGYDFTGGVGIIFARDL